MFCKSVRPWPLAAALSVGFLLLAAGCGQQLSDDYRISCAHEHLGAGFDVNVLLAAMDETDMRRMVLLGGYETLLAKKKPKDWSTAHSNNLLILDAAKAHPDRFIPFVLLDANMSDPVARLEEYTALGARGVKLYNGLSSYRLGPADSPEMRPIYQYCQSNNLPVLIHMDVLRFPGELDHICQWYPDLIVIAPHLLCRPENPEYLESKLNRFPNLYTDISYGYENWMVSSFKKLSKRSEKWRELFLRHPDRIFFGTDVCVSDLNYKTRDYLVNQFNGYRKLLEFGKFRFTCILSAKKEETIEVRGLHLDRDTLKAIYEDNFERVIVQRKRAGQDSARSDGAKASPSKWASDFPLSIFQKPPEARVATTRGLYQGASETGFQTPLVFAAHFTQPVDDLSTDQADRILGGKIASWKDLGGTGEAFLLLCPGRVKTALTLAFPDLGLNGQALWLSDEEIQARLSDTPGALALLPIRILHPRFKVLTIDGVSPFENRSWRNREKSKEDPSSFLEQYPLVVSMEAGPFDPSWTSAIVMELRKLRFSPGDLKTILMTGSSLLGQGIAYDKTPPGDPLWPVKKIAPYFRSMDIAHLSQENPLVKDCVQEKGTWKFCSEAAYIEAIKYAGFRLVELTGNHQTDLGRKGMIKTLNLYDQAGLDYFGGGRDLADAKKFRVLDIRGTRFAFLGYNHVSGSNKLASEKKAGANPFDVKQMIKDIHDAKNAADVVFINFQWGPEFDPQPRSRMVKIARRAIAEGAAVVTGTHAHRTSAMEFDGDGVVFYGLGNFLFVHPGEPWTERSIVVKYTFLKERMLNIQPIGVALENFQSRWLDPLEEDELLSRLYAHSMENLNPFPSYPVLAANVQVKGKKDFRALDKALGQAAMDEAVVAGYFPFGQVPTREQCRVSNQVLLSLKPRYIEKIDPLVTLHPEDSQDDLASYAKAGAVGFRLLLHPDLVYSPSLVRGIGNCAEQQGLFVELEQIAQGDSVLSDLPGWIDGLKNAPVIFFDDGTFVSDPQRLSAFLDRHPKIMVGLNVFPDKHLISFAGLAASKREQTREVLNRYRDRIVLGPGLVALGDYSHGSNEVLGLYFRAKALKNLLERQQVAFPLLSHRGSEWSYKYEKETLRPGLALSPETLQSICSGNMTKLIYSNR